MKLSLTLNDFFDLVENKVLDKVQGEILFNNLMTKQNKPLPYVYKSQLKVFRKMGLVKA